MLGLKSSINESMAEFRFEMSIKISLLWSQTLFVSLSLRCASMEATADEAGWSESKSANSYLRFLFAFLLETRKNLSSLN